MKTPIPITKTNMPEVKPALEVQPPEVITPDVTTTEEDDIAFAGNDRVPAYWDINALENGDIEATNSTTGSYFKGTMEEFKKCLRG
jgi:hypothetical protein